MTLSIARSELILGGQKSGKSRRAELLARDWLAQDGAHRAILMATGQPWDDEMRQRIARHQSDRAARVPGMATVEEPLDLAAALRRHSTPQTLLVVDCLTLWLTNWTMPTSGDRDASEFKPSQPLERFRADWAAGFAPSPFGGRLGWGSAAQEAGALPGSVASQQKTALAHDWQAQAALFLIAIESAPGPVVLVGNEIGLGVIPLGREVRAFVDALGVLNQQVAHTCQRVTLMAAGLPLSLKEAC